MKYCTAVHTIYLNYLKSRQNSFIPWITNTNQPEIMRRLITNLIQTGIAGLEVDRDSWLRRVENGRPSKPTGLTG